MVASHQNKIQTDIKNNEPKALGEAQTSKVLELL